MKYIFRLIIAVFFIFRLVVTDQVGFSQLVIFLLLLASNVFRVKYHNLKILVCAEYLLTFIASVYLCDFTPLFAITCYDIISFKAYPLAAIPMMTMVLFMERYDLAITLMLCAIAGAYSYTILKLEEKESLYREMFDKEREYSYQLERSKNILQNSAKDAARLAEIKERNRIAREIHDNIGHSIAGTLMQLQAAKKLVEKGDSKGEILLGNSIQTMSESLELIRNTVHNIKPAVNIGIEYIKEIMNNFKFCPIDFKHRGDVSGINPEIMESIVTNLKELLTNASKYSSATKIDVSIDVNEKYIRLFVRDNGRGCSMIRTGMGLSGIKERISNIGGTVAISGDDGFTVVCLVPLAGGNVN